MSLFPERASREIGSIVGRINSGTVWVDHAGMARRRVEVDRSSSPRRAAIESEPVIVGGRFAATLPELYELLDRVEQRRIETGDWPLLNALLSDAITEAGDCKS